LLTPTLSDAESWHLGRSYCFQQHPPLAQVRGARDYSCRSSDVRSLGWRFCLREAVQFGVPPLRDVLGSFMLARRPPLARLLLVRGCTVRKLRPAGRPMLGVQQKLLRQLQDGVLLRRVLAGVLHRLRQARVMRAVRGALLPRVPPRRGLRHLLQELLRSVPPRDGLHVLLTAVLRSLPRGNPILNRSFD